MNKRIITRVRDCLSELDMPYFNKELVTEIKRYSNYKIFKLDFIIPFNSMQNLVRFCEDNNCNIAFDKEYGRMEFTIFEPTKFALRGN